MVCSIDHWLHKKTGTQIFTLYNIELGIRVAELLITIIFTINKQYTANQHL